MAGTSDSVATTGWNRLEIEGARRLPCAVPCMMNPPPKAAIVMNGGTLHSTSTITTEPAHTIAIQCAGDFTVVPLALQEVQQ